jgi:NAD(P)H dehydrogenase (quinone)
VSIVITGASGQLAKAVIDHALETIDVSDLILVTRSPGDLGGYAARGATVRYGDFEEPESLRDAFVNGRRMLLISTDAVGDRVDQHAAAIDAAVKAGVEMITYTSMINPVPENPAFVIPDHRATEQKLLDSGLAWVFLRNSMYAEFQQSSMTAAASSGTLVTNTGSGAVAYVSREDCAAAAAAVLVSEGHAGNAYDITGPELIDAAKRAEIFAGITGKTIEVVQVDDDSFAQGLADATGMPISATRGMASFGQAAREGYLAVVSADFEKLTGRKARDLGSVLSA